jgi:hypothetical protein
MKKILLVILFIPCLLFAQHPKIDLKPSDKFWTAKKITIVKKTVNTTITIALIGTALTGMYALQTNNRKLFKKTGIVFPCLVIINFPITWWDEKKK